MNQMKTVLLMALLTGVAVGTGWLIGGQNGMLIAFGLAALMNFAGYWWSDKLVLAMYRAREVSPQEAPQLHAMVAELAQRAAIPMPKVYIVPGAQPNAFATGRNPANAAVAVTDGLLQMLDREEVMAVLAHEIGHVLNRDILIGTIAATFAGAVSMLANMLMWTTMLGGRSSDDDNPVGAIGALVAMLVAPFAAMLVQMAISRSREFHADETAARLMGTGRPLASALSKLAYGVAHIAPDHRTEPATAHMFIVNPLSGRGVASWFSTHPPMELRIERLLALDAQGQPRFAA
ncbi:MAG: zinc metalloprotease HtpX [Planctomycetes bacterium]|nr:zinc metalloprotease HtpX [Planctomycetota bacterium]